MKKYTLVKFQSIKAISEKAVVIKCWDGSEDVIPTSQILEGASAADGECWIASWILPQKNLQYSDKNTRWIDEVSGAMRPDYIVEKHSAEKVNPVESNDIASLRK